MGNNNSVFSEEKLEEYQDLTFLTKKEILHVFDRFRQLDPDAFKVDKDVKEVRLSKSKITEMHELKENPFKERICEVFSSSPDGDISFEDFLDMMSVFSDGASKQVKVEFAFRIYDFNNDSLISSGDLKQVIDLLTGDQKLPDEKMQHLIDEILNEGDLDGDGALSFAEFQHVLSRTPDFFNSFRIHL